MLDVCMYIFFFVCVGLALWIDLRKSLYIKRVLKCESAYDEV